MRPRATKDLTQLSDSELLTQLAKGMRLCVANALRLWRQAKTLLRSSRAQGFTILRSFVEEEAAKFHILLDAARCPRNENEKEALSRQLGYFNQHLAKGLYAKYYNWRPADLEEVRRGMDQLRKDLYLDGPNDADWIFRNDVLRQREETVYVDYVEGDEGYFWHAPNPEHLRIGLRLSDWRPKILRVALAIHGAGLTHPEALPLVASHWRGLSLNLSTPWTQVLETNEKTLETLDNCGLLRPRPESVYSTIINDWLFPLFPLDLSEIQVDPKELRKKQSQWGPPV